MHECSSDGQSPYCVICGGFTPAKPPPPAPVESAEEFAARLEQHVDREGEVDQVIWLDAIRARDQAVRKDERREVLTEIGKEFAVAEEERWQFQDKCRRESEKWKSQGDMYGCNFHQGMSAGANWADLYYARVGRALAQPAQPEREEEL